MSTLTEATLIGFIKKDAVKRLDVIQGENRRYRIVAAISQDKVPFALFTSRGHAREWVSLDRLMQHISEIFEGKPPPIRLKLAQTQPASPAPPTQPGEILNEDRLK